MSASSSGESRRSRRAATGARRWPPGRCASGRCAAACRRRRPVASGGPRCSGARLRVRASTRSGRIRSPARSAPCRARWPRGPRADDDALGGQHLGMRQAAGDVGAPQALVEADAGRVALHQFAHRLGEQRRPGLGFLVEGVGGHGASRATVRERVCDTMAARRVWTTMRFASHAEPSAMPPTPSTTASPRRHRLRRPRRAAAPTGRSRWPGSTRCTAEPDARRPGAAVRLRRLPRRVVLRALLVVHAALAAGVLFGAASAGVARRARPAVAGPATAARGCVSACALGGRWCALAPGCAGRCGLAARRVLLAGLAMLWLALGLDLLGDAAPGSACALTGAGAGAALIAPGCTGAQARGCRRTPTRAAGRTAVAHPPALPVQHAQHRARAGARRPGARRRRARRPGRAVPGGAHRCRRSGDAGRRADAGAPLPGHRADALRRAAARSSWELDPAADAARRAAAGAAAAGRERGAPRRRAGRARRHDPRAARGAARPRRDRDRATPCRGASRPGNGMALANVRERLRLLHDVDAQFEVGAKGRSLPDRAPRRCPRCGRPRRDPIGAAARADRRRRAAGPAAPARAGRRMRRAAPAVVAAKPATRRRRWRCCSEPRLRPACCSTSRCPGSTALQLAAELRGLRTAAGGGLRHGARRTRAARLRARCGRLPDQAGARERLHAALQRVAQRRRRPTARAAPRADAVLVVSDRGRVRACRWPRCCT